MKQIRFNNQTLDLHLTTDKRPVAKIAKDGVRLNTMALVENSDNKIEYVRQLSIGGSPSEPVLKPLFQFIGTEVTVDADGDKTKRLATINISAAFVDDPEGKACAEHTLEAACAALMADKKKEFVMTANYHSLEQHDVSVQSQIAVQTAGSATV